MKKIILANIIFVFSLITGVSHAQVNAGISIGSEGVRGFYLSVGEYYRVPEREVILIHERNIADEELPVVFFIAGRAGVEPGVIVNLRLGGMSWYDISIRYRIYPEAYYIPLSVKPGPPYGKAYGYYKNKPRKEWRKIKLSDNDIVNLVNLRFISEHYKYPPEIIVKMRTKGNQFVTINDNVKKGKNKSSGKSKKKK